MAQVVSGPKDRQSIAPSVRAGKDPQLTRRPKGRHTYAAPAALKKDTLSFPALTDGAIDCRSFGPEAARAVIILSN